MDIKREINGSYASVVLPLRVLLRHIGNRSDHHGDRRDAGADAQQFGGACAAQDLAGHHDLAAGFNLALRNFGQHVHFIISIQFLPIESS